MTKKVAKKAAVKAAPKKTLISKKPQKNPSSIKKTTVIDSLIELIRITSTVVPDDVQRVLRNSMTKEEPNTTASYAMGIIKDNIDLAKIKSQPLCQDTGTVIFFVYHPPGFFQGQFKEQIKKAVVESTKKGYLRQNSVNSLTGENAGTNLGEGHPSIHFYETNKTDVEVKLVLKGGGCENVSAQYSLPDTALGAGRDLAGVRKVLIQREKHSCKRNMKAMKERSQSDFY